MPWSVSIPFLYLLDYGLGREAPPRSSAAYPPTGSIVLSMCRGLLCSVPPPHTALTAFVGVGLLRVRSFGTRVNEVFWFIFFLQSKRK